MMKIVFFFRYWAWNCQQQKNYSTDTEIFIVRKMQLFIFFCQLTWMFQVDRISHSGDTLLYENLFNIILKVKSEIKNEIL